MYRMMAIALLAGAAAAPLPPAAPALGGDVAVALVRVTGVKPKGGTVQIGLYDAATFMRAPPLMAGRAKVDGAGGTISVRIGGIAPGDYAVMAFHDANGNGRLDMADGRLAEGTALTNAAALRGMPTFAATKIALVPGLTRVAIAMSYPEDRAGW